MKKTSVLLFLLAFAVFPAMSQLYNPYAKWSFELRELPDNEVELQFHLKLEKDWEIYSQNNDPSGPVTWFNFSENSSYILAGKVKEPEPYIRKDDIFGTEIRYFTNSVVYSQRIRRNTSSAFEVRGNIEYQLAKNGQTIAPEKYRFVFKVPAAQNQPVATGKSESVGGFVDLGLPSGTLWKYKNETDRDMDWDHFTYDNAVKVFGKSLPTREEWDELTDECEWTFLDNGFMVVGPNGNSIILQNMGYRDCNWGLNGSGAEGYFWSGTPDGSDKAWALLFMGEQKVVGDGNDRCFGFSVRLVKRPDVSQNAAHNTTPAPQPGQQPKPAAKKSDADVNIPTGGVTNNSTYAFIIANENYPNREVPYALNDGRTFAEYCNKTLGIPQNHIKVYENATIGQIVACVASIKRASEANSGDLNVIFYYAGHAFPDESTKDAYLMPVDGDSRIVETCYSLKRLYKGLSDAGAKSVVCFLDACFSGATREDDMLLSGRGVAIKPKEETPQGNLIVFTSASGSETAHQYEDKGHGLFTYFLLKKLQQSKGSTTLGELYDYLSTNVKRTSYDVNQKIQTPSVIPSTTMEQKWRNIKL